MTDEEFQTKLQEIATERFAHGEVDIDYVLRTAMVFVRQGIAIMHSPRHPQFIDKAGFDALCKETYDEVRLALLRVTGRHLLAAKSRQILKGGGDGTYN